MKVLQKSIRYALFIGLSLACAAIGFSDEGETQKWDVQPAIKKSVAPDNPKGIDGMVMAIITIDENGMVQEASIAKTTDDSLAEPVLAALKMWRFSPAELGGQSISCQIKVPFKFKG